MARLLPLISASALRRLPSDEFERLWIWREDDLSDRLAWYRQVATNRMPAKFKIAARIPIEIPLESASEEELWATLDAKTPAFLELRDGIRRGAAELPATRPCPSLLDLCRELTQRLLRHCTFCRWHCRVDRSAGTKLGTCKLAEDSRVSSYFHHPGEELIYRGRRGSGTIFFTSCNLRCAFCQNGDISTDKDNGQVVSARALATMAWLLRMEGCHNVNWVGGEVTIHLHTIVEAISLLEGLEPTEDDLLGALGPKADGLFGHALDAERATFRGGFNAPMLWNSNFFMSDDSLKILRLLMDVWLPDLKFGPGKCAVKLSRTPWYWETVTGNIEQIHGWGEELTIRHLVMPNHVDCCTRSVLEWVAATVPDVPVNVMDQFHPDNFCDPRSARYDTKYAEIGRRPTAEEIRRAFHYAKELGIRFAALSYEKNMTGLRA